MDCLIDTDKQRFLFYECDLQGSAECRSLCGLFVAVDAKATADKCGSIPKVMPMRSSVT